MSDDYMDREPQLAPLTTPPSLDGLDSEERVEAMVGWFFENFEDPAHETPYDGREGGYQYVWGGPYEASDYIYDHFPDATEEEHTEAIDRIDADGPYWAPAGERVLPPDDEEYEPPLPPLEERLAELSEQLDTLTGHVSEMLAIQQQGVIAGIGHNNPPPDEDDPPTLDDVLESIAEVKAELAKPNPLDDADIEVIEKAEGRFSQFLSWFVERVKEAPTLLAQGAIQAAGALLLTYAVAHSVEIVSTASSVSQTVSDWATHLNPPF